MVRVNPRTFSSFSSIADFSPVLFIASPAIVFNFNLPGSLMLENLSTAVAPLIGSIGLVYHTVTVIKLSTGHTVNGHVLFTDCSQGYAESCKFLPE